MFILSFSLLIVTQSRGGLDHFTAVLENIYFSRLYSFFSQILSNFPSVGCHKQIVQNRRGSLALSYDFATLSHNVPDNFH